MNDKQYKKLRRKLRKLFNYWGQALGLQGWRARIHFYRDGFTEDNSGKMTVLRIRQDWKYKNLDIDANMPVCLGRSTRDLAQHMIHEYCHALTGIMNCQDQERDERAVTELAWAILWSWERGFNSGRDRKLTRHYGTLARKKVKAPGG